MSVIRLLATSALFLLSASGLLAAQIPTTNLKNIYQFGQLDFCARLPKECVASIKTPGNVQFSILEQVQKHINETVSEATDSFLFGKVEHWSFPKLMEDSSGSYFAGDCEDFAIMKRWELRELHGLAQSQLLLTTILIPMDYYIKLVQSSGGSTDTPLKNAYIHKGIDYAGHIALVVRSPDKKDYLLDSLHEEIVTWEKARDEFGYVFVFLENPADPKAPWQRVIYPGHPDYEELQPPREQATQ